jgi:hypothetical protein
MEPTKIRIELPDNYMNAAVTVNNTFVADTNDSSNWQVIKLPLPEGKWNLYSISGKSVTLLKQND